MGRQTMTSAALILSAGESRRFGGYPKALLSAGRRTAVRRIAEIALDRKFDPVVVVVGVHRGEISRELRDLPVEVVDSERWYEGRTASIQSGVVAIPPDRDILLWPIDHPFVSPSTADTLTALLPADPLAVWFIPTYEGQGGHPILWRSVVRNDVLELRSDAPVRSLIPEFGPQVRRVPVDDPAVADNTDTPEAYRTAYELWLGRGED